MTMLRIMRWFITWLNAPTKEHVRYDDSQIRSELAELHKLVDSLCANTQPEQGTGEHHGRAQLHLAGRARMRGFRLIQQEAARYRLADLEAQKKELLEDHPALRNEQ